MKTLSIQQKLRDLGINPDEISLGDFDMLGEFCAKKVRAQNDPNWKHGAFFRPNYERGILIYSLIVAGGFSSYLEVGWGRGYSALCAAKAFYDLGLTGSKVVSVDISFDRNHIQQLAQVLPRQLLNMVEFHEGPSAKIVSELTAAGGNWDLVYIDGDHTAAGTKADWEVLQDHFNSALLFDDYREPSAEMKDIDCARVIDEIDEESIKCTKEYIKLDRLMFPDDRFPFTAPDPDRLKYGQVLLTRSEPITDKKPLIYDEWTR